MNIFYGTREYAFEMSHALFRQELSNQQNFNLYGPEYQAHGHNWKLKLSIQGPKNRKSDMIVDLSELDKIFQREVDSRYDHRYFDIHNLEIVPTLENLTKLMWNSASKDIDQLYKVELYEYPEVWGTYLGGDNMYVTTTHRFCAQHRTHNPKVSEGANQQIYGKCNRYHGHTYILEVTIKGKIDEETGLIVNKRDFDSVMDEFVPTYLNYQTLNEFPELKDKNATTENMLEALWGQLNEYLITNNVLNRSDQSLYKLKLVETDRNYFEYFGPETKQFV